jgi:protease-4
VGDFFFKGMSAQASFFKKALEKLDIEVQIIRHGKFKSAVEPFMLEAMSRENREQTMSYVGSIWNSLLTGIAEARNIPAEQMNEWIDNLEVYSAQSALDKKLVDGLKYYDEVLTELSEKTNAESIEDLRLLELSKYGRSETVKSRSATDKIAVIYAEGNIMTGEGSSEIMSATMSKAIRSARLDDNVKAIVFRINSGGGSALASDVISREIQLASEVKPVIASLGDVAASGGYYIATQADVIVADPTTITGSIGVFGVIPNYKEFMNNKLGITFDVVTTNKHSDFITTLRPMTAEEQALMQKSVEDVYDTFITLVSKGRNMSREAVDEIGQGRVWSAVDAKRLGLVDELGGVNDAVRIASEKAGISDYRIEELPKQSGVLEALLSGLSEEIRTRSIRKELGEQYRHYRQLKDVLNTQGIQARMPYTVELY